MKYIEKVILQNFQSHKNSVIEFDNQLNVIIGPSDSGKTAILRGIKWALYNEPSGDYFIREGETECSVTIVFDDGTRIKRYRNKTKNIYYIYDANNNETKFEGFGTSVPQEVIDKTGIKKILLDSDQSKAINLSDQLEGSFLLSERGSVRANSIGRLVGVNIIDDSLRETLRDSRNLSIQKKGIDDNILSLETELLEYEYLPELRKGIDMIEIIRSKIYNYNKDILKYKIFLEKLTTISEEKKNINYYIDKLKDLDLVDKIANNISSSISNHKYLYNQVKKIDQLKTDKAESLNIIQSLSKVELADKNIEGISRIYSLRSDLAKLNSRLEKIYAEKDNLDHMTKKLIHMDVLQDKISIIDESINQLKQLDPLMDRIQTLKQNLSVGNKYVDRLKDVNDISDMELVLENKIKQLLRLELISKQYMDNRNQASKETNDLNKLKESIKIKLDGYQDLLLKQKTCPLCFSNIDKEKINHIVDQYN